MEENKKIVKVYSNNSKKARLKRNKNKFQRIWDAEKQTYIKVRKSKFPPKTPKKRTEENIETKAAKLQRRKKAPKKPKSVPVIVKTKPETTQRVQKEPARVHGKSETHNTVKIHRIGGVDYSWDSKTLSYKRVALY